ncbi:MAG: hypothetical protein MH472_14585 [Bacteroidia bacterium]|nr:hypothetical protein [Bacteroidia bacterium]
MKKSLKYLSTLILIPFVVFLRGDMELSVDTFMFGEQVEAVVVTKNQISEKLKAEPTYSFVVKTKVIAQNPGFTGDGLPVHLYDSTYQLIGKSQIMAGKVKFTLQHASDTASLRYVVLPSTASEVEVFYGADNNALLVEEVI